MTSTEAELVKYAHNVFGAIAVTYANHLYDVSQTLHADYEKIFQAFSAPPGVKSLRRYGTIFHNNKRGYGGPCFPKDVNSFLVFCKNLGIKVEIIQAARDANRRLLRAQHLTEQTAESY
jgi:UDPglucose 6-dehydrogenase